MIRAGVIILSSLTLAGCELINHDRTAEPAMASLINHSYVINKDSFLLENYCLDEYTTKRCLFLQAVGGWIYASRSFGSLTEDLPKSFEDYERNKSKYYDSLQDKGIFYDTRYPIVVEIPKGTIIKVTRLISVAKGEAGRDWVVYGQIASQGADVSIQIGPHFDWQGWPRWFVPQDLESYYLPPRPKTEFLSPVDGNH